MINRIILIFFLFASVMPLQSQNKVPAAMEDSLFILFKQLGTKRTVEELQQQNDLVIQFMSRHLVHPESFTYHFDSLKKYIGILDAPDGLFRIFTWNIPLGPFEHEIHGILQLRTTHSDSCVVHILKNRFNDIPDLLHTETDKNQWPGSLYYDLRRNKRGKTVFYTLMGYNFHDRWSDKKIIDILHFDSEMNPVFGKPVFQTPDGIQHRVVFEFSGDVAMSLRYNPDLKMIVYHHLAPIEPELKAHPRFYAPDFSYDGYKYRRGIWEYRSDIDVRNR